MTASLTLPNTPARAALAAVVSGLQFGFWLDVKFLHFTIVEDWFRPGMPAGGGGAMPGFAACAPARPAQPR